MTTITKYAVTETSIRKEWVREAIVIATGDDMDVIAYETSSGLFMGQIAKRNSDGNHQFNGYLPSFGQGNLEIIRAKAANAGYTLV